MVNRRTLAALAAIGTIATGNLVAGCVKSGSDSTFFPPTPTPAPPATIRHCQAVWTRENAANPAKADAIVLDAPADFWLNGGATLATSNAAGFVYYLVKGQSLSASHQIDVSTASRFTRLDTSGSLNISNMNVNGSQIGSPVTIDDTASHKLFTLNTAHQPVRIGLILSSGKMDTVFSDISGAVVSPLDTSATARAVLGTHAAVSYGAFGSYIGCYDVTP